MNYFSPTLLLSYFPLVASFAYYAKSLQSYIKLIKIKYFIY